MCFFVVKLKFMVILCEKMHMISILVRYGFRWHSDKPYQTRLRLVRYGLSECHLNPYRTRMDTICISYYLDTICISYYQVVFSSQQTYELMHCVEHISLGHRLQAADKVMSKVQKSDQKVKAQQQVCLQMGSLMGVVS